MNADKYKSASLPVAVFVMVVAMLTMVQLKADPPMLLLERFLPGGGWIELLIIGGYGALVAHQMQDPSRVQKWRRNTWFLFSVIFFVQLILGLIADKRFLMSGKLHLPVPMMILAGPIYRGHLSVMSLLFVSTLLLSGPAWCSHLCYFGALDSMASGKRKRPDPVRNKWALKSTILLMVITAALLLRWLKVPSIASTLMAGGFGVTGLGVVLLVSRRKGNMVHCTSYCPLGTVVNLTRFVNPFRLTIDAHSCNHCMACTRSCRYDALNPSHIQAGKPGATCTLCGDCFSSCHSESLRYRFFTLSPKASRSLYLFITVSLHAATLALARI